MGKGLYETYLDVKLASVSDSVEYINLDFELAQSCKAVDALVELLFSKLDIKTNVITVTGDEIADTMEKFNEHRH